MNWEYKYNELEICLWNWLWSGCFIFFATFAAKIGRFVSLTYAITQSYINSKRIINHINKTGDSMNWVNTVSEIISF